MDEIDIGKWIWGTIFFKHSTFSWKSVRTYFQVILFGYHNFIHVSHDLAYLA